MCACVAGSKRFLNGASGRARSAPGLVVSKAGFNFGVPCKETSVRAGHRPALGKETQMTSNTPVPIGPANAAEADDEKTSVDSAEADRLASQGEDTSTVEQRDGDEATDSADADYEASMGKNPETD
jgi:hypothetical protein